MWSTRAYGSAFAITAGIVLAGLADAQNLVSNGDFEQFTTCPSALDQISVATGWSTYRGTCDYYNACNEDTTGVPWNWFGYQPASSGVGYAGIYCFSDDDGNPLQEREWFGSELITPLVPGAKYFVSFRASCTMGGSYMSGSLIYAADHLGVLFSHSAFLSTYLEPVPNHADVFTESILADSTEWSLVTGSFIADSAYSHIVVGNLFDDATTDYLLVVPGGLFQLAYYYIDDVCVSVDSLTCLGGVGITEHADTGIRVFPVPFTDRFSIAWTGTWKGIKEVELFDTQGRAVPIDASVRTSSIEVHIYGTTPDGVYVMSLLTEDGSRLNRMVVHSSK